MRTHLLLKKGDRSGNCSSYNHQHRAGLGYQNALRQNGCQGSSAYDAADKGPLQPAPCLLVGINTSVCSSPSTLPHFSRYKGSRAVGFPYISSSCGSGSLSQRFPNGVLGRRELSGATPLHSPDTAKTLPTTIPHSRRNAPYNPATSRGRKEQSLQHQTPPDPILRKRKPLHPHALYFPDSASGRSGKGHPRPGQFPDSPAPANAHRPRATPSGRVTRIKLPPCYPKTRGPRSFPLFSL